MANVKTIHVTGSLPFDLGSMDHPGEANIHANTLAAMLGRLQMPTMGTQITWSHDFTMVPNRHGGMTTMCPFTLHGTEALNFRFIETFKRLVRAVGGTISNDTTIIDLEA